MIGLHPSLWLKFQRECSNLLYVYQEKNEELLRPAIRQQHHPTHQQQFPIQYPQQQYPTYPNVICQPPPPPLNSTSQQWPISIAHVVPTSGSQDCTMSHSHLTQIQSKQRSAAVRQDNPAAASSCSTPVCEGETSFNLSSLFKDNIEMSGSSVERVVTALVVDN